MECVCPDRVENHPPHAIAPYCSFIYLFTYLNPKTAIRELVRQFPAGKIVPSRRFLPQNATLPNRQAEFFC